MTVSFNGKWVEDKETSTPYQDVLEAQGVSWALRQVSSNDDFVVLIIKLLTVQYTITDTGTTLESIDTQGTKELATLDNEWVERKHPIFGPYKDRMARLSDSVVSIETSSDRGWAVKGEWRVEENGTVLIREYEFTSPTLNKLVRLVYKKQE
ncbi:hypothetical protein SmJEL517_g03166 [Synchytrium microbalum]|uniref:Uncharacterized protein n=1 Tax=Synchytrium microbalum TaxID=1806994 RepID=A0A507C4Q1_9FUNG|nr:uncharacterized protein SmJEL517_g03166 [Synchytrium microbalum]TPX34089.1 hypothetical protein SmJEL517_g03166 [Synchytrium microbalum]